MMNFENRTAIVTGGGHGIGRAIAEALADRGARVVVADTNVERATKIASRIADSQYPAMSATRTRSRH
jgi:NAD(P)-dependent dehydrogenase (short-subunit alcohol dehydrogenase family)